MMEKKRSVGVTVFGWSEILLGLAGTLFFIFSVYLLLRGFWLIYVIKVTDYAFKGAIVNFEFGKLGIIRSIPFIVMLIAGIGIIKTRPLARKINISLLPILAILSQSYFLFYYLRGREFNNHWILQSKILIFIVVMVIFKIWFFTRPKVKEQFR